jgi:ATP phosphoribosyltransferase regulatory subunit
MSSAWLLPEHIADVLPSQARQVEELRRSLLDTARSYGYELVIPPLLEYLESLLSGMGKSLDLRTFRLIDQLSGKTMGVRADTTPQVARIDAHLLNRVGLTRLCYCGPVVHTHVATVQSTREPLQFGAEIYGHHGLEADLEILDLGLDCARRVGMKGIHLDLGDARVLSAICPQGGGIENAQSQWFDAFAAKDAFRIEAMTTSLPAQVREAVLCLLKLYGDPSKVLTQARRLLSRFPDALAACDDLAWLVTRIVRTHPDIELSIDLGHSGGNAYYTGPCFTLYAQGSAAALIRGGRYDAIGAIFGRNRPAVGLSLDVKVIAELMGASSQRKAIRAPSNDSLALRDCIRGLREQGHTVLCVLPGHENEVQEFECDRELVQFADDEWRVKAC